MQPRRAVIVGCGHNAAVLGALLTRAGYEVLIFEARSVLGGAASTETLFGGKARVSRASYVLSLFPRYLIDLFELHDILIPRRPSSVTPIPDARPMFLGPGANTAEEIARFSKKDAAHYVEYTESLEKLARILEPWLTRRIPYPNEIREWLKDTPLLLKTFRCCLGLTRSDAELAQELLTGSVADLLESRFESDILKGTLATDGIIGSTQSPREAGTAYVLLHHVMGNIFGERGVWGYVQGGMGKLTERILAWGHYHGNLIVQRETPVKKINFHNGRACGVTLENETDVEADIVISNAHPITTFRNLIGERLLPFYLQRKLTNWKTEGASAKVNLLLSGLPKFFGVENPQDLQGTIHIAPSIQYIERAHEDYLSGDIPTLPMIEIQIPSLLDDLLTSDGRYVANMFVQYVPYDKELRDKSEKGERLFQRILNIVQSYAKNIENIVLDWELLTPYDLEQEYGLIGGNIFHGEMRPGQLPPYGRFDYRYPELQGFYLCGSGGQHGGGVTGGPGLSVARLILGNIPKAL